MKRKLRLPIAAAALACVAALPSCGDSKQNTATATAPPPAVTVVKAELGDVRPSITFTGRVEAIDKVDLRARIDGFLEQELFKEGADVKADELLFVIEKGLYVANVEQAKGGLEKAKAALALADIEVDRQSTLVARDVASKAKLDEAIAKQGEARGEVAQRKAALERAELELSYTDIRAPVAGRIGRSAFSIGNFVTPSSGMLATIVSQDPIYVSFPVTQREILEIRKTQGANSSAEKAVIFVELADGSRYAHPGTINFVDVTVNPGTDTVQVRASFPNPDRTLVDGQLVSVVAQSDKAEQALLIPQAAVQVDQAGPFVLIVDSASKIEVRRIETDKTQGTHLRVRNGLVAGDRVVTEGVQKVRPGQVVQATETKPEA